METVIGAATVLMFLPAIVVMFRYIEIEQWLDGVGRYVTWERSVWADRAEAPWDRSTSVDEADRVITRSDADIARHALLRTGLTRRQLMVPGSEQDAGRTVERQFQIPALIGLDNAKRPHDDTSMFAGPVTSASIVGRQTMESPERSTLLRHLANRSTPIDLGVVKKSFSLEVSDRNMASVQVGVRLKNLFSDGAIDANALDGDQMMGNDALGRGPAAPLTLTTRGALQTNTWSPRNEDVFARKVHNLDVLPIVELGATLASLGRAPAANASLAPLDGRSRLSFDRWTNFAPVIGQVTDMWPRLTQNTSKIPFNRVKIYDYDAVAGVSGPQDAFPSGLNDVFLDGRAGPLP